MKQYDMLPAAAHFGEPHVLLCKTAQFAAGKRALFFFACFDLMNWKDYGIMK